jgi:hypothetical protein
MSADLDAQLAQLAADQAHCELDRKRLDSMSRGREMQYARIMAQFDAQEAGLQRKEELIDEKLRILDHLRVSLDSLTDKLRKL